jgi:hypothetical protein
MGPGTYPSILTIGRKRRFLTLVLSAGGFPHPAPSPHRLNRHISRARFLGFAGFLGLKTDKVPDGHQIPIALTWPTQD